MQIENVNSKKIKVRKQIYYLRNLILFDKKKFLKQVKKFLEKKFAILIFKYI